MNKYAETIRLFNLCVEATSDVEECNRRGDAMVAYFRENFELPPKKDTEEYKQVLKETGEYLLRRPRDFTDLYSTTPTVSEVVYPIAVMSMALNKYCMPFCPTKMKEFDWFHDTYGTLVLTSVKSL